MPIDPKYIKTKIKSDRVLRGIDVPKVLKDTLQKNNINLNKVCEDALREALINAPKRPETMVRVQFKSDPVVWNALLALKLSPSEIIRQKFKELVKQIGGQALKEPKK